MVIVIFLRALPIAVAALFAASSASADMCSSFNRMSLKCTKVAVAASGYAPSAVHFSTETTYSTVSTAGASAVLGANGGVDTPTMIVSWWLKGSYGTDE